MRPGDPIAVHWNNGSRNVVTRGMLAHTYADGILVSVDRPGVGSVLVPWRLITKVRKIT